MELFGFFAFLVAGFIASCTAQVSQCIHTPSMLLRTELIVEQLSSAMKLQEGKAEMFPNKCATPVLLSLPIRPAHLFKASDR